MTRPMRWLLAATAAVGWNLNAAMTNAVRGDWGWVLVFVALAAYCAWMARVHWLLLREQRDQLITVLVRRTHDVRAEVDEAWTSSVHRPKLLPDGRVVCGIEKRRWPCPDASDADLEAIRQIKLAARYPYDD